MHRRDRRCWQRGITPRLLEREPVKGSGVPLARGGAKSASVAFERGDCRLSQQPLSSGTTVEGAPSRATKEAPHKACRFGNFVL